MCLIAFAWQSHPRYRLVVAANRDEYFARPAQPAHWWPDTSPRIFAGRDELAGGTWMGISRNGRFAALTNHRDPAALRNGTPSRGALVAGFLSGRESVAGALERLAGEARRYNGFNLLIGDSNALAVFESHGTRAQMLRPGVYSLSNGPFQAAWPKQRCAEQRLASTLGALPDTGGLFDLLRCDRPAADAALPRTGIELHWERMLSSAFIRAPGYGTRCSTVLTLSQDGAVTVEERSWNRFGGPAGRVTERFTIAAP